MTKKDYVLIAQVIGEAEKADNTLAYFVSLFCHFAKICNERFDERKFRTAIERQRTLDRSAD